MQSDEKRAIRHHLLTLPARILIASLCSPSLVHLVPYNVLQTFTILTLFYHSSIQYLRIQYPARNLR